MLFAEIPKTFTSAAENNTDGARLKKTKNQQQHQCKKALSFMEKNQSKSAKLVDKHSVYYSESWKLDSSQSWASEPSEPPYKSKATTRNQTYYSDFDLNVNVVVWGDYLICHYHIKIYKFFLGFFCQTQINIFSIFYF